MPETASDVAAAGADGSGPAVGSPLAVRPKRLQDELDAADEKLRQVAQHFSVEWKAFLAYAMKLKQETPEFASFPDKQRLEDLLLRSQSGLVMLREMQQRREEKWRQLLPWWTSSDGESERARRQDEDQASARRDDALPRGERPSTTAPSESAPGNTLIVHRRAFLSRYTGFLEAVMFMCQRFLTRRRLLPEPGTNGIAVDRMRDPAMVQRMAKKLQWALNVRDRLRQAIDRSDSEDTVALGALADDDVHVFARFQYLSQQHAAVFERFFVRLRWLPTAYRYHIRHRMMELAHQQVARSAPLSPLAQLEKAKVTDSVGGSVQCPLFPICRHPIEQDTKRMLAGLHVPLGASWVASQLTIRSVFRSRMEQTRLPCPSATKPLVGSTDAMSLLPGKVVRSRWGLMQMTSLGDEPMQQARRELDATSTDLLLRNELELLDAEDVEYARARLQSLVKCHVERAIVETTAIDVAAEPRSTRAHEAASEADKARLLQERWTALGATEELPIELLDVWYTTRYLVCRQLRQRLLRSLNYQHFLWTMRRMQAMEVRRMSALGAKATAWRKKAEPHDAATGKWHIEETESGDSVVLYNDEEHIFPQARRDLAALESHLLQVASVFLEKQQRGVFDAMASGGDAYPFSFVLAVDRMQVLVDLFDVELRFQLVKVAVATQMLASGHEFLAADAMDTGGDMIGRVLQRRPLIDFEHAYFYDSYVAETVQLELKRELFRAMSAVSATICEPGASGDAEELWLHQQLIADGLATTYMRDVDAVLRQAEQQWFVTTSVTELHALQQAIHERMLVIWRSLLAIEMPSGEQHSLQHTPASFFRGNGWRAGVKPDVLLDVCAGDDNQSTDVRCLVDALELLAWRHDLGLEVYESSLLEKIWNVQQGFVGHLRSSSIDDPALLFHDDVDGAGRRGHSSTLATIADVLNSDALVDPTASNERSATRSQSTQKLKNVADWLRASVRDSALLAAYWERCHGVLWMQQHYRWSLTDLVRYNDLVSAEIIEFAATSPFYFLSAFESTEPDAQDGGGGGGGADHALSLKAVHWKYMDEIVERIEDAAKRTCAPYWMPLMELQHQLCMRRARATPNDDGEDEQEEKNDSLVPLPQPAELAPCAGYLHEVCAIPKLMIALSSIFEQLRHEERLMSELFPDDWLERCAFSSNSQGFEQIAPSGGDALSSWLNRKLEQLKLDVKAAKADSIAPTPVFASSSSGPHDSDESHASNEEPKLLLRIPSTSSLLALFSVKPSGAGADVAASATAREESEAALRALLEIFECFQTSLEMLRAETALGFFLKYEQSGKRPRGVRVASVRRIARLVSSRGLPTNASKPRSSPSPSPSWFFGKELLGAWHQALHRAIQSLHDRLLDRLGASAALRDLFAPIDWDSLRRRHQAMLFRREVAAALREVNAEWRARLRCTAMALSLQALSYRSPEAVEHREPEIAQLLRLEASLMEDERVQTQPATSAPRRRGFPVLLRLRSHEMSVDGAEFYRALGSVQDVAYLRRLGDWLDLVFALLRDHMKRASGSTDSQGDVELALLELERAVERYRVFYRLPADAEPLTAGPSGDPAAPDKPTQAGSVSGTRLRMKTPAIVTLLTAKAVAAPVSVLARALRAITRSSARKEGENAEPSGACLALPTLARVEFQIEMFRVHLQIQWIEDDVQHMQRHYESFLEQRRAFQAHVKQARKAARPTEPRAPGPTHRDVTMWLLHLSRYFQHAAPSDEQDARYVIPADDMVELLNAVNQHLDAHYSQMLLALEQAGDGHARESRRLRALADERQLLVESLQRDEQLKRETYAVDRRYELVCQLEKQRHEMALLASRKDMERELLRRELTVAFEQRLHAMHVALLAKQQTFDEYRQAMQQDLKQQLHAAHAQLVHQLVDHSGSMSVETKTGFLASLDGQVAQQALQHENVALKHTLLKLQTLHEMHEQTRQLHAEKERATAESFRLREQQLVSENAQLQHQVKQLEAKLTRTAQDRTYHQIKLHALERQTEAAAERRRQAKVRALSAPFRRHAHALVEPDADENAAAATAGDGLSPRKAAARLPDPDAEQEAFERAHEVAIRRRPERTEAVADPARLETQCHNTLRHYQNEIRRLQQQLARETRLKAALMERVASQTATPPDESADGAAAAVTPLHTRRRLLAPSPSPSPLSSPRLRAASASTAMPRRPATGSSGSRRPSTSIGASPARRDGASSGPSERSESTDSAGSWTPRHVPPLSLSLPSPAQSAGGGQAKPPRSAQSATPHRRFEVVKRDDGLAGGVAGVANPFSPREPLPYR
ncbi:hypothetical protein ATCC90586_003161 [Pythium insidiosum]|nr:hypothetical protein ATCC90586_003161 [Pythium insidiosum]